jgi:hypothetical protein
MMAQAPVILSYGIRPPARIMKSMIAKEKNGFWCLHLAPGARMPAYPNPRSV